MINFITTDELFSDLSKYFKLPEYISIVSFDISGQSQGLVQYSLQCFNTNTNTLFTKQDYMLKSNTIKE